jgi:hypothetical protein
VVWQPAQCSAAALGLLQDGLRLKLVRGLAVPPAELNSILARIKVDRACRSMDRNDPKYMIQTSQGKVLTMYSQAKVLEYLVRQEGRPEKAAAGEVSIVRPMSCVGSVDVKVL